jgi:hypothetical protein
MKEQEIVGKVVEVLREVPPEKIDEVVVKAKNQLESEGKKIKKEDLEKLFSNQIKRYEDANCPEQVIKLLKDLRDSVIEKASKMTLGKGNLPFLLCTGKTLSLYSLMAMVKNSDKVGYNYLTPTDVTDQIETPDDPYAIFDVEDGEAMLGKSMQDAEKAIKAKNRFVLTAAEAIALCIQTDVLKRHYVDAPGSRYGSAGEAPDVYLGRDDRPGLGWDYLGGAVSEWGSASCGSR